MSWHRVDDQFHHHPKAIRAGRAGRELWHALGSLVAAAESNGRVAGDMLEHWCAIAGIKAPKPAVAALVDAGLWHDADTLCARCTDAYGPLLDGDYQFHDWTQWNLDSETKNDELDRMRERRRKALHRNPKLKAQVRQRDRDLCRYCGVLTIWSGDRRSSIAGTFDHIDPFCEDNYAEGLCVACRTCNGRKRDRTPDQAEMVLHEPGYQAPIKPYLAPYQAPDLDRGPVNQASDLGLSSRTLARRDGAGSDLGRGLGSDLIQGEAS